MLAVKSLTVNFILPYWRQQKFSLLQNSRKVGKGTLKKQGCEKGKQQLTKGEQKSPFRTDGVAAFFQG